MPMKPFELMVEDPSFFNLARSYIEAGLNLPPAVLPWYYNTLYDDYAKRDWKIYTIANATTLPVPQKPDPFWNILKKSGDKDVVKTVDKLHNSSQVNRTEIQFD